MVKMIHKALIMTMILVLSSFYISSISISTGQQIGSPSIKDDAPNSIQLMEDSPSSFLNLYDIYNNTGGPLNFTIWNGQSWNKTLHGEIINITIRTNATLELFPLPNMHGVENIVINATNTNGSNTHHHFSVSVLPTNDPYEFYPLVWGHKLFEEIDRVAQTINILTQPVYWPHHPIQYHFRSIYHI